jgi:hypothetical protein
MIYIYIVGLIILIFWLLLFINEMINDWKIGKYIEKLGTRK